MNRFVTAGGPTGTYLDAGRVVGTANEDSAVIDLLEMTLQTEIGIALGQQLGIDRAMGLVTGRAAFANGFVLENVRAALRGVTSDTEIVLCEQRGAAGNHDRAFVRRVTGGATDVAFGDRMVAGKLKLTPHVRVAFETGGLDGPRWIAE